MDSFEGNPERFPTDSAPIFKEKVKGLLAKAEFCARLNGAEAFLERTKNHERIREYREFLAKGGSRNCGILRVEVSRAYWRVPLESPKIRDLRTAF